MPETHSQSSHDRAIGYWLLAVCALVFAMVVLGGVTRLTGSGLSMVDWEPVRGILPPLNEREWQVEFSRYQQFPEFRIKNLHMGLPEFKTIFWFEYSHRLLGRTIGIAFLIPFLYFLLRGRIHRTLTPKLVVMFCLGGLQGLLGWYMVKSGLVDDPSVSQYRLTAHLVMAFAIYGYMLWVALDILTKSTETGGTARFPATLAWIATLLIVITVISGGFVAGLKAGHAYNTFPLMDGRWFPEAYFHLDPKWINPLENIAAVQFDHRVLALATLLVIALVAWRARNRASGTRARSGLYLLFAMALVQVALGISTLLLHVPVALAASHQAGALILFTIALFALHASLRESQ